MRIWCRLSLYRLGGLPNLNPGESYDPGSFVVGASGIIGSARTQLLIDKEWQVAAPPRHPSQPQGQIPVAADLLDAASLEHAGGCKTHSRSRQATEAKSISVNAAMVRNVLSAIRPAKTVEHVALFTGLKHYLGPFEAYGTPTLIGFCKTLTSIQQADVEHARTIKTLV